MPPVPRLRWLFGTIDLLVVIKRFLSSSRNQRSSSAMRFRSWAGVWSALKLPVRFLDRFFLRPFNSPLIGPRGFFARASLRIQGWSFFVRSDSFSSCPSTTFPAIRCARTPSMARHPRLRGEQQRIRDSGASCRNNRRSDERNCDRPSSAPGLEQRWAPSPASPC